MLGRACRFHYYFCFMSDRCESRILRSFHLVNACASVSSIIQCR
jgi:hypothetical protein